jgi:hypothetical protein
MRFAASLKPGAVSAALLLAAAPAAMAQESEIDPDIHTEMRQFADAPHFIRTAPFASLHVARHWPFIDGAGEVTCITVDGVALAMFKADGRDEPFMLGENLFMSAIGTIITGETGYIRAGYDHVKLATDLEKTYHATLKRCGTPYAQ